MRTSRCGSEDEAIPLIATTPTNRSGGNAGFLRQRPSTSNMKRISIIGICLAAFLILCNFFVLHHQTNDVLRSNAASEASEFPGALDEIVNLHGKPASYNARLFSGYLSLPNGGQAFYFFAESQRSPTEDPVMLWLNGGPGASSLAGCFTENGPLLVNDDGQSLRVNPFAWNQAANLLCIESPIGVGFSYNTSGVYASDDLAQAADLYDGLQQFFVKFPSLRSNEFVIAGESYGGVYVPATAHAIVQGNLDGKQPTINLKKFVVGNGVNEFSGFSAVLYAYYHGLLGTEDYQQVRSDCPAFKESSPGGSFLSLDMTSVCGQTVMRVLSSLMVDHINTYDIYGKCAGASPFDGFQALIQRIMEPAHGFPHPMGNPLGLCLNATDAETYFNLPQVRQAMHTNHALDRWSGIALTDSLIKVIDAVTHDHLASSHAVVLQYTAVLKHHVTPLWRFLLDHGVNGVIYHGDADIVCDLMSGLWAVESLHLPRTAKRAPWFVNASGDEQQNAGFVEQFDGMTYLTVRGAGHMVPRWKPAEAKQMLDQFVLTK